MTITIICVLLFFAITHISMIIIIGDMYMCVCVCGVSVTKSYEIDIR